MSHYGEGNFRTEERGKSLTKETICLTASVFLFSDLAKMEDRAGCYYATAK